jgi:hypothetical protein
MTKVIKFIVIGFFAAVIPLFFIGCFQAKEPSGSPMSAAEINRLSREVTVEINGPIPGSGVIVGHGGGVYYVLTAQSVADSSESVEIIDPLGISHTVNQISNLPGLEIALLSMESNDLFMQVEFGETRKSKVEDPTYLAGFNAVGTAINERRHQFSPGKLASTNKNSFSIDARALEGFSGGPVFNEFGEVLGIYQTDSTATGIAKILKASREFGIELALDNPSDSTGSLKFQRLAELPASISVVASSFESGQNLDFLWSSGTSLGFSRLSREGEIIFSNELIQNSLDKESRLRKFSASGFLPGDEDEYYLIGNQAAFKREGNLFVNDGTASVFMTSFSESGDILWEKTFGQDSGSRASDIAADLDGNIIVCGNSSFVNPETGVAQEYFAWLAKFDSMGDLLWRKVSSNFLDSVIIDSPDFVQSHSVAVNDLGETYVVGEMNNQKHFPEDEGNFDAWISKFGPGGNLLWSRKIGNHALESLNDLKIGPDGTVFAWGSTTGSIKYLNRNERPNNGANEGPSGDNNNTFWIMALDKNDALIFSDQIFNFTVVNSGSVIGFDLDGSSYVVYKKLLKSLVSGTSVRVESEEHLRKYTSTGQLTWDKRFDKPKFWSFKDLSIHDSYIYVLVSDSSDRENNGGDFLIKYSIE